MTDPEPVGWRVTVARSGTYAAAKQKPETHDFATRDQAETYAATMRTKGNVVCVVPQYRKPYQRGAKR